jgi:hypothetical protein
VLEERSLAEPEPWALLNGMRPGIGRGLSARLAEFALTQLRHIPNHPVLCRIWILPDFFPDLRGFEYPFAGLAEGR